MSKPDSKGSKLDSSGQHLAVLQKTERFFQFALLSFSEDFYQAVQLLFSRYPVGQRPRVSFICNPSPIDPIGFIAQFTRKNELIDALGDKLSRDPRSQDYVFQYFFDHLPSICPVPTWLVAHIIKRGLTSGDKRFKAAFRFAEPVPPGATELPERWETEFRQLIDEFWNAGMLSRKQMYRVTTMFPFRTRIQYRWAQGVP